MAIDQRLSGGGIACIDVVDTVEGHCGVLVTHCSNEHSVGITFCADYVPVFTIVFVEGFPNVGSRCAVARTLRLNFFDNVSKNVHLIG